MIDIDEYEGHTEGKWTLEKVEQTDAEHEHYLLIGNNLLLSVIHHGGQEWDEHEANAQLIADAPLLKEEIKRIREILKEAFSAEAKHSGAEYLNMIAKVTGLIE